MNYTKLQFSGEEGIRAFALLMALAIVPNGIFYGNETTTLSAPRNCI